MRVFAIEVMDPRVVWQVGMAASEAGAAHVIATDLPGFSACDALCAGCDLKRACGSSLRSSLRASLSLSRARALPTLWMCGVGGVSWFSRAWLASDASTPHVQRTGSMRHHMHARHAANIPTACDVAGS